MSQLYLSVLHVVTVLWERFFASSFNCSLLYTNWKYNVRETIFKNRFSVGLRRLTQPPQTDRNWTSRQLISVNLFEIFLIKQWNYLTFVKIFYGFWALLQVKQAKNNFSTGIIWQLLLYVVYAVRWLSCSWFAMPKFLLNMSKPFTYFQQLSVVPLRYHH